MKQTLGTDQAASQLIEDQYAGWSYAGARALVEWLEELENDTGEEIEFCPVAIRCDFSEYDSAREAAEEYTDAEELYQDCENEEEREEAALEYLHENTTVIEFGGGVIVQAW